MADTINMEYKNLACYTCMSDAHRTRFDVLTAHYGPMLNKGPSKKHIIYTLHDFDHHCFDIYRIISNFILGKDGLEQLNTEELYLLNLSVLFHDISMCKGGYDGERKTEFNRNIHSLQSSQWLNHEYKNRDSVLYTSGDLSTNQVRIIRNICQAHSDLKDLSTTEESGLSNSQLPLSEEGKSGSVRAKALAGILRLADELDVTSDRLGNSGEEDDLSPEDKDDLESKKHWDRLHLIRSLKQKNPSTLYLVLDEEEVKKRMDSGDSMNVKSDLTEIKDKIQKEIGSLRTMVIEEHQESSRLVTLHMVELYPDDSPLFRQLFPVERSVLPQQYTPMHDNVDKDGLDIESMGVGRNPSDRKINLLSPELSMQITQYVRDQKLLVIGHYQLNGTFCARDWLNTLDLINRSNLASKMVQSISNHIANRYSDQQYTIVGLDIAGTIEATKIAFCLDKPFTYVIPVYHRELVDGHEVNVPNINDDGKIILITDSIVTGSTISQVIQDNHWEGRVLAIYSIFYRAPKKLSSDEIPPLDCDIYVLNKDFSAEVSYVKDCPYGVENCQATNKKYDGGAI